MRRAVTNGTCHAANIPGYEVCGKTGTAQNRGHDHSAFMGFAPMNNPRIAVAVYVENGGFGNVCRMPITVRQKSSGTESGTNTRMTIQTIM